MCLLYALIYLCKFANYLKFRIALYRSPLIENKKYKNQYAMRCDERTGLRVECAEARNREPTASILVNG